MFDRFTLKDFAPGEGVALGAFAGQFDTGDWIDVPDPFYDRNELDCAWVEEREWWYRPRFTVHQAPLQPDERLLLVFHGLDTYVTIWLNGEELGQHGNMFRPAVFDVSRSVRTDGPNTLALCFEPPLDHVSDVPALSWGPAGGEETKRNLMRKAQFGFGWDWGPRLPTIGIWRPDGCTYTPLVVHLTCIL
jgi:beta-mannosidase